MRILFFNHSVSPYSGVGRFYISLTSCLKHLIPGLFIKVATSEDLIVRNKLKLLWNLPRILKMARQIDLLHALDGWPYGFLAAVCAKLARKKLVITAVGTGGVKPLYNFWQRPLLRWAYRRADKLVAVSNQTKKEILKIIPDLNIEVINHGVSSGKYQTQSAAFAELKPYILTVGAWKKRKGLEYSIEAYRLLKKEFSKLKYVILSNPPDEAREKYSDVDFVHNIPENNLIGLYQNAELFILLPQDDHKDIEGFGLVYLEAAAAGLPVIGGKYTSAEDALRDGKNGFLVDGQDVEEAADRMREILSNPALRSKMSAESKKFAQEMTWEKAASAYQKIYSDATQ